MKIANIALKIAKHRSKRSKLWTLCGTYTRYMAGGTFDLLMVKTVLSQNGLQLESGWLWSEKVPYLEVAGNCKMYEAQSVHLAQNSL